MTRMTVLASRAPFLLPIAGALIVGLLFLRKVPESGGEGIPEYIIKVNRGTGNLSPLVTLLKYPATLITLGLYGSGGLVGPLARIGAGAGSFLAEKILSPFKIATRSDIRTAAICGMSGTISALFHAPLGGAFFAAEILKRDRMKYTDLFPAILSGSAAYAISLYILRQQPIISITAPGILVSATLVIWFLISAIFCGAIGMLFIISFEKIAKLLRRLHGSQPLTALVGSIVPCALWLLKLDWSLGISSTLRTTILTNDISHMAVPAFLQSNLVALFAAVIIIKIIATSFTIGSGMSAGFTGPLIIIGLSSGALIASLVGFEPGSPEYYALLACGLPAALGAALNIPIAAIIISIKIFGVSYTLPALVSGILAFLIYKAKTIYTLYLRPETGATDDL